MADPFSDKYRKDAAEAVRQQSKAHDDAIKAAAKALAGKKKPDLFADIPGPGRIRKFFEWSNG